MINLNDLPRIPGNSRNRRYIMDHRIIKTRAGAFVSPLSPIKNGRRVNLLLKYM